MRNRDSKNGRHSFSPILTFAAAFLAARAGAIPGRGFGLPALLLEASLWTGLYFALRAAGVRSRGDAGKPSGPSWILRVPVYSKYVKGSNGMIWHHKMIPPEERSFVDNYSLLQYDLLIGEQHILRAALH